MRCRLKPLPVASQMLHTKSILINYLLLSCSLSLILMFEHTNHFYNKLNDYLIKNVYDPDNFDENFNKANELLIEENKSQSFWNKNFRLQLENFLKLKQLDNYDNCNDESLNIIHENNLLTDNRAGKLGAEYKSLRRVDYIVNHFIRNHVNLCWPKYYDLYMERRNSLDNLIKADYVERFLENVIEANRPNKEKRKYFFDKDQIYRFMLNIGTIDGKESARSIYKSILEFSNESKDEDRKYLIKHLDERKGVIVKPIKNFVEKYFKFYIIDSCEYYVNELNDIMKPIIYDYNLLYRREREQVDRNLFASMSYFKLCQIVLDETSESLKKDVIKIALKGEDDDLPNVVRKPIKEQIEENKSKFKNNLLEDKKFKNENKHLELKHKFIKLKNQVGREKKLSELKV